MSSIIYRTNPASGYVYAYKSTSFWDPKLKRPRSHQEYLGRVDPETKEILPKGTNGKRNRGPSRKSDPQKDAELDSMSESVKQSSAWAAAKNQAITLNGVILTSATMPLQVFDCPLVRRVWED